MPETFEPRQAEPNQRFAWGDEWGARHEAQADAEGVLRPRDAAEAAAADAFGLPASRGVIKGDRAASKTLRARQPAPPPPPPAAGPAMTETTPVVPAEED